jgi:hypothetical protein
MARRSYLQRIAEPLRSGDPVLFAVPRPAPDEARPAAETRTSAAAAPSTAPVLRRRAIGSAAPASPAAPPATAGAAHPAPPPEAVASVAAPADAESAPAPPAFPAISPAVVDEHDMPAVPFPPPAAVVTAEEKRERAPRESIGGVFASPRSVPAALPFDPAPGAAPGESAGKPEAIAAGPGPVAREPDPFPPPAPLAPLPTTASPPTPRIHIGTVEVRSAAVPPPPLPSSIAAPPASPANTMAIPRAYTWRFGLVQG